MRPTLLTIFFLLVVGTSSQSQIVVGGRPYARAPNELGKQGEWVLYPLGAPPVDAYKEWLTRRVLVEMEDGAALGNVAGVVKADVLGKYTVLTLAGGPDAALDGAARVRKLAGVKSAEPLLAHQQFRRSVPNDPLFAFSAGNPGYQWHLRNTGQNLGTPGIDVNVVPAWNSWSGAGVKIGIVDDGLEVTHPDLAPNVDSANDYDFNNSDDDPSPGAADSHGTACAGVAAARGNNSLGGSGAAPEATLVGMRLISAPTTDADEAQAFSYRKDIIAVKSNSWGPFDGGYGAGGPGGLSQAALLDAVTTGRAGLGTVFVWAAGNGNQNGDDSNYDGWAASPYAMAVGAVTDKGEQAYYSEPGANILVCAPSNGGAQGITTTDRVGAAGYNPGGGGDYASADFTRTFGGTSAATPLVSGVAALMLQAGPGLGYRDVQEILVRTANKIDANDPGWVTNGAGFHFNVKYGAGLVDAAAATTLATTWTNLPAMETFTVSAPVLALAIPDGNPAGVAHTFSVAASESLRVEHVTVHVDATHPYRGNLEWFLTSPSGVRVRLARARLNDTGADLDWTFMTTHFWGERSEGNWSLQVVDPTVGDVGTLNGATVMFFGTPVAGPPPAPVITSPLGIAMREGAAVDTRITASNFPTSFAATGLPTGVTIDSATGRISGEPTGGDALYLGTLSATNESGTTTESAIFQVLGAEPALSEAVELPPSAKIVPFGYADWSSQSLTTHDGVDAAQSGAVGNDEYSGMEMTVTGPTTISFHWKVSSEADFDYLVFVVDGDVRGYISGEKNWASVTYAVGPGTHNIGFNYFKDANTAAGQDAGWIDEILLAPITTPPVVTGGTVTAYVGVPFRYQITGTNAPTNFSATGLPAGLTLAPSTGLITGTLSAVGSEGITLHATNGFGTGDASLTILTESLSNGLAAAVDAPGLAFVTTESSNWAPQTLYSHDGQDAARSGSIGDLSQSVMTTVVDGPAMGSFFWGVSSEATFDFLRFFIDDVEQAAIAGEVGWTRRTFTLPAGTHTLKWAYIKDDFVRSGLDAGFVDQLSLIRDADGDGYFADKEAYFGTSDADANSSPSGTVSFGPDGAAVAFPSVSGNHYRLEFSDDLILWSPVTVTATGTTTIFLDPAANAVPRRFYRVGIP
jgi:subtilisin-like proprotein convertase family protein